MSSQGAKSGATAGTIPPGYVWNSASIRDSSDYTKYKKQVAIFKSTDIALSIDPWFVRGQDYRLEWLNGRKKCTGCTSRAFSGGVTFN